MKIYNLRCQILTPLHIGDGKELQAYEYVIKDKFYKILFEDFVLNLSSDKQREVTQLMETDIMKLRQFLKNNFEPARDKYEYSGSVSEIVKNLYETKIAEELNRLTIYPFIRTLNKPFIPGSSIKGAIRTAIIAQLAGDGITERNARNLEATTLKYGIKQQNDPFRAVKISDSILSEDSTIIDEIVTVTQRGQIKTIREITSSQFTAGKTEFNFEIRIDKELLEKNKDIKVKLDIESIATACNSFYKEILIPAEIKYFSANPTLKSMYERLASIKTSEKSFLLRLGWGQGKNSISLNLKTQRPRYVKTRRLIRQKFPLGWVEATYA
ncbi:type III-A CRISPR-associated RAMP protein Csm5 [Thermodesulfovibrionales bacterium]|nr:type III-A CRISPR-associated RAMP protein Csm5 [Thermodesulfovibrionales bacterium]